MYVNTIVFKGQWKHQFDKTKTKQGSFYLHPRVTLHVPMMTVDSVFRSTTIERFQYYGDNMKVSANSLHFLIKHKRIYRVTKKTGPAHNTIQPGFIFTTPYFIGRRHVKSIKILFYGQVIVNNSFIFNCFRLWSSLTPMKSTACTFSCQKKESSNSASLSQ